MEDYLRDASWIPADALLPLPSSIPADALLLWSRILWHLPYGLVGRLCPHGWDDDHVVGGVLSTRSAAHSSAHPAMPSDAS
jgi:hypothetical protein